jgi:CheY-like chemotaxis protein
MGDAESPRSRTHALDDEVLADFGHQLRNQLNAIVGAAGLLSATATSSDQRELASIVLTGSEQVAGLVDEVLDSELIQSGNFELALHPFNLRSSAEACLGRISGSAASKGITITFRAATDAPTVIIGDSRRLEQVLYALLRMAVERTDRGGIEVELTCDPNEGPLKLRFRIHDAGLTFSPQVLEAGLGGTAPHAGLGPGERLAVLSLHTAKRILEMMDGDLDIRSTGVDGSAATQVDFTFLAVASEASDGAAQSLAGMQVLVVVADATERRVLAMQAELWGAPSASAEPAEAPGLIAAGRAFDVALIEHRKPVVDGLALAAALRATRGPEELPIILIVAGALGAEEVMAADNGLVQATLAKPVTPQKLHDVMAQVGRRRAMAPAAAAEVPTPGMMLNILVADDNSLNQNMLRRQITKLGHKVDVVSNGREAVSAVESHPYDALLMDVLMPEMDGLAAAAEICRRWSPSTRPRLIALTAMAGPGDEERCRKAGFDDYMSKPVHLDELAESLAAAAGWRAAPKVLG